MKPHAQSKQALSPGWKQVLRGACYLLLAFGILLLGYAGFFYADAQTYQALEKKRFREHGRLTEPHTLVEGDIIGEIQVPRLGLSAMVVQGDSRASLRRAVGHLSKSALPGERGNVALAGHRDTFFRPLKDIRLGDEIRFKTSERNFEYLVESIKIVEPTDIEVLEPTTGHDLTFISCFPFYYVGPAPKRFVVRAREVTGPPAEYPASE
jgi:sortase A